MLPCLRTYLLGDGDVLSRVVLAGLLRVVRYRPLALGELLGRGFGVRHFELLVSLVSPREVVRWTLGISTGATAVVRLLRCARSIAPLALV